MLIMQNPDCHKFPEVQVVNKLTDKRSKCYVRKHQLDIEFPSVNIDALLIVYNCSVFTEHDLE